MLIRETTNHSLATVAILTYMYVGAGRHKLIGRFN